MARLGHNQSLGHKKGAVIVVVPFVVIAVSCHLLVSEKNRKKKGVLENIKSNLGLMLLEK